MIFFSLLSILVSLVLGYSLVSLCLLKYNSNNKLVLFKIFLSPGVGFGISSFLFYLYLLVFDQMGVLYIIIEVLFCLVAVFVYLLKKKDNHPSFSVFSEYHIKRATNKLLLIFALFVIALTAVQFIRTSLVVDNIRLYGHWDSWVIWNFKAKYFLSSLKGEWRNIFAFLPYTPENAHGQEYPLFLSSIVAKTWLYSGTTHPLIPCFFGWIFTFSLAGLLMTAISIAKSNEQAYLAGILFFSWPFIQCGNFQYADIVFGYTLFSSLILLFFYELQNEEWSGWLFLSGFFAGLSGWTKIEGQSFILVMFALLFILYFIGQKTQNSLKAKKVFIFLGGGSAFFLSLIYFTLYLSPGSYLASHVGDSLVSKLTDFRRYQVVLKAIMNYFVSLPILLTSLMYLLIVGIDKKNFTVRKSLILLFPFFSMLAVYCAVFLVTPSDIEWHVQAFDRLNLHIITLLIFYFIVISDSNSGIKLMRFKRD